MRILFIADAVSDDLSGGSRTAAKALAEGLTLRGHSVTFLVARHLPNTRADETRDGIRTVRYEGAGAGPGFVASGRRAAKDLFHQTQFDIVHTHFAYAGIGPLSVAPKSVPRVRTFHGPWDEEGWVEDRARSQSPVSYIKARLKKQIRARVERVDLHRSDKVIVLSDSFKKMVLGTYGVTGSKLVKIPGGVDTTKFAPLNDSQLRAARSNLGIPADRPIILTVRRLTARMGIENLIRAMPDIIRNVPNVMLLVGGKGPMLGALEQLSQQLGLSANIRFVGFIPSDKLAGYYQCADLFVLPTTALEGFGLVTVEALSCGTPVIGTPVGATPEILNKIDRRLVTSGIEPAALEERISSFFVDNWRHDLTRPKLHKFCENNYSWEKNILNTEYLYSELINAPG